MSAALWLLLGLQIKGWFRFLARNLRVERVLLIATYRPDELYRGHPLRAFLAELERNRRVERIDLELFTHAEVREQLADIYALFPRLGERRRQFGGTLSGGEQQMLAIGRALMSRPNFILMDEPSMGLAPALVETIYEIVRSIKSLGTSMLIVEQNATMALALPSTYMTSSTTRGLKLYLRPSPME